MYIHMVLTNGISSAFRDDVQIHSQLPLSQYRVNQVTQLGTDGVPCRESAGTGPVVPNVISITGAAFAASHGPINVHLSFPPPLFICNGNDVWYIKF